MGVEETLVTYSSARIFVKPFIPHESSPKSPRFTLRESESPVCGPNFRTEVMNDWDTENPSIYKDIQPLIRTSLHKSYDTHVTYHW